ncbi:hypothetical protein [Castellaniella sp. MT123]|uniref:hypothetical protein n=1 Tax=Castellaniella sp. MT123 TaxID=3140381 RepID=UPI0031F3A38E
MSSTTQFSTQTFTAPSDKVPNAILAMAYREPAVEPGPEEMELAFSMLDDLLGVQPFAQWEIN